MHPFPIRFLRAISPLLIVLAAGSCGPGKNDFAPACPIPGLVKPLATLERYRGASRDIRDMVIRAQIINIVGRCEPGDANTVIATAQVVIDLTRGPAMEGLTYALPLFVAVTDSDGVRDKIIYALSIEFTRNVDTARAMSQEVRMEIPVTPQKSAAAFGIVAGFQLTSEEVAAKRRSNPR